MRTANFLPWRQRQRQGCLRFWGLLFTGSLLLALMLFVSSRVISPLTLRVAGLWQASDRVLYQALEQRHKQAAALHTQRQQQQRWAQQKAVTRSWQPTLIALSGALPDQAWLATLRFQQSTLQLKGYAATLPAVEAFETALRQLPGFTLGTPGEMRQDAQGRWQFAYSLTRKELADADPS